LARACFLLSGGKDSNYAIYRGVNEGLEPACILTVRPERPDSWMFQSIAVELARLQARAMGLEAVHYTASVSGLKEREVAELASILERLHSTTGFEVLAVGGLASEYQRRRFELVASRVGARLYSPAWGVEASRYLRTLVREGFRFILVSATAMGLTCSHVGRVVDEQLAEDIIERARRYGFHPALEGGEGETLVLWQPLYRHGALAVRGALRRLGDFECHLRILEARLEPPPSRGRVELVEPGRHSPVRGQSGARARSS
jgi:diphthine-ammonia ligase